MDLITFLILCVILGFAAWMITTYVPMPPPVKNIVVIAVVLVLLLILVRGLVGDVHLPRLR